MAKRSPPAERQTRQQVNRSILDWISHDVARLQKGLGPSDRGRLDAYLDNVREIERRIQRIEKYNSSGEARQLPAAPLGVPDSYEEHVKLMFDLQALAFAGDITGQFVKVEGDGEPLFSPTHQHTCLN